MQEPKVGASRCTAYRQKGSGNHFPGIVQQTEYGVNL